MGGQSTIANSETKIEALKLQSSVYGAPIPVLGGVNRVPGNLVWYGDFTATANTSTQDQGGKGGGVKTQNTTYSYTASVLMGICQGPVGAIARVWKGKEVFTGGWSPAALATATETYTPPGSGTMAYTLAHAATLVGLPVISYLYTTYRYTANSGSTPYTTKVQLADGRDYTLAGGTVTILAESLRGKPLTIEYQWGTGAPDLTPLTTLGITLANGDMAQAAPAWLTASHPTEALAYPGLAYVHAQAYSLGNGAQVENHSFEVQGSGAYRYGAALPDCNPAEFTADVLTNGRYGARMPADALDLEAWRTYCRATGLLLSPLLTEQVRAGDFIEQICSLTNAAPVWSFDRLLIVPYGDTAATGNGATYTPDTTPRYDLDDDHWLQDGTEDPLRWALKEPADRYNHVRVEFSDRANYYNRNIAEAKDDADIAVNGLRTMATIAAPWVCDMAVARLVAQIALQRSLNISGTGTLRLPWAYCLLECMDLVTLTDVALDFDKLPVRITAIGEDEDGMLELEVEDWPLGSASATRYPSQVAAGFQHDYNAAPGNVQPPVIFEAPGALTTNGLELYVAATGLGGAWGGCDVWVSLDGSNYKRTGTINGGSRYGTLSGAAGSSGAVPVQLLRGTLLGGSAADAAALNTLCFVRGTAEEYLAYQTATLTGALQYSLAGATVRGAYGTAAAAHASGATFVRVDEAVARSGPIDLGYVGRTISVKLTSFNVYGGAQQGLADVPAYTYTVTGARVYGNAGAAALAGFAAAASDNVLTAGEKPPVVLEHTRATAEQAGIDAQASAYGITTEKTAYDSALSALTSYLGTLASPVAWDNLAGDTAIVGTTFRSTWASFYAARQALLNKFDASSKALADAAASAAATAQGTASGAASAAAAANTALADIASDNVLTPGEKPAVVLDRDVIVAEQAGIDAQATSYGVTTEKTAYDTAVSALTTYLATLTSPVAWDNLTGNTTIVGATFRSKFGDVYTTRQALLNKIAANAKALADAAQGTANTKVVTFVQGTAPTAQATGDLWMDSSNGNKISRWNGSAWVALEVGTGAIAAGAATQVISDTQAAPTASRTRPGVGIFEVIAQILAQVSYTNTSGATQTVEVSIDGGAVISSGTGSAWLGCNASTNDLDGDTIDGDHTAGMQPLNSSTYSRRPRLGTLSLANGATAYAQVYVAINPTTGTMDVTGRDCSCRLTVIKR